MTDWMTPPTGEDPDTKLTEQELDQIRESLKQRGHADVAKQVRDHYSPRQYQPNTFVAYQGENPVHLALEILATLVASDIAADIPDRLPTDHESTFGDHLDRLRAKVELLGELQHDTLMDDKVWFWTNVQSEAVATREQLVQDIKAQMEARMQGQLEHWVQHGYRLGAEAERKRKQEEGQA